VHGVGNNDSDGGNGPAQLEQVAVDTGRVDPDDAESAMDGSGVPMLELFLRKEAPAGELRRKLVAVRASPVEDASTLGQQLAESLQELEGLDSSKAVLKVSSPTFCACFGNSYISRLMHGGPPKQGNSVDRHDPPARSQTSPCSRRRAAADQGAGWFRLSAVQHASLGMTKTLHLQVDKYDGTGPVKVTLDLSGESASSDSPDTVDSNQPESTSDEDDAAKFLQVQYFQSSCSCIPG